MRICACFGEGVKRNYDIRNNISVFWKQLNEVYPEEAPPLSHKAEGTTSLPRHRSRRHHTCDSSAMDRTTSCVIHHRH